MGLIRDFIIGKEEGITQNSNTALTALKKNWKAFLRKDTYLIYDKKNLTLDLVKGGIVHTAIPWYLFWDHKLKTTLTTNVNTLNSFEKAICTYNSDFVAQRRKEYADLFRVENFKLDEDQQKAVITDDKHNLVVAGAGAGKTQVLITRIAYLIKRKSDHIEPHRILALAFQNKAANEIKERLEQNYGINSLVPKEIYDIEHNDPLPSKQGYVTVGTFHSLGYKIIKDAARINGEIPPRLKQECSNENGFNIYIKDMYDTISNNDEFKKNVADYMMAIGDKEKPRGENNKEEYYRYMRELDYTALNGVSVESKAEKTIMDFFLSHTLNGIDIHIDHAQEAKWMKYENKRGDINLPKPDFHIISDEFEIYWEHWALDKKGNTPHWFKESDAKNYLHGMKKKRKVFKNQNKYLFIETFSWEALQDSFLDTIHQRFLDTLRSRYPNRKFSLTPLTYEELVSKSWTSSKFIAKLPSHIARFIQIAKCNNLYPTDIDKRMKEEKWSPEQRTFVKIANSIYLKYQDRLNTVKNQDEPNTEKAIDFADMINKAAEFLKDNKELYKDTYDQILIDEYQDISPQRYELIKALMDKNPLCKLFCVGDDWQSIMGFTGSDLDYFINFNNYFHLGDEAKTDLMKNYRSTKTIVEAGASIIKHSKVKQIKNSPLSHSGVAKQLSLYSIHEKAYPTVYLARMVEHCLNKIKEYHEMDKNAYPYDEFLVLIRISKDIKVKQYIEQFRKQLDIPIIMESHITRPNCVRFMTVHQSKGMQAKIVFILNLNKGLYGFPCELENPDIYEPAIRNNNSKRDKAEEERRLFYVALTRAKEEVIMYTQKGSESEFITEIRDYVIPTDLGY